MFHQYKNEEDEEESLITPAVRKAIEKRRQERLTAESIAMKETTYQDVYEEVRRAVNNGNFSYRDLAVILKELFDEDEREALKKLL